jgi:hypothetical protein
MGLLRSELKTLQYWIEERERIRVARQEMRRPPWTKDPVLANWRFTNVRRDFDKVSVYIKRKIIGARLSKRAQALACLVARRINWIPTLDAIGFPRWDAERARRAMAVMAANGQQVFGGAYMMMGGVNVGGKDAFRPLYDVTVDDIIEPAQPLIAACVVSHSLQDTWTRLRALPHLGPFMAGQVAMDMHITGMLAPNDLMKWAPIGPGSIFGLNILHGREQKKSIAYAAAVEEFRELKHVLTFPPSCGIVPLYDVEHCVCEYMKYRRGWGKQRYPGAG